MLLYSDRDQTNGGARISSGGAAAAGAAVSETTVT